MAYADTNSTNRKLGATAAVVALEAGLAWAIIAGLSMTITHQDQPRTATSPFRPRTRSSRPNRPLSQPPSPSFMPGVRWWKLMTLVRSPCRSLLPVMALAAAMT